MILIPLFCQSPTELIHNQPELFDNFTMIIATNLHEKDMLALSDLCDHSKITLIAVSSKGLCGVFRIQAPEHPGKKNIHPSCKKQFIHQGSNSHWYSSWKRGWLEIGMSFHRTLGLCGYDWYGSARSDRSWSRSFCCHPIEIRQWMETAGIIWRDGAYLEFYWLIQLQHDNQPPASYSERNQLKECIRKGMHTVDEENFEEALANVWRLATTNTASPSILFF